jgi:hypothetical protein
VPAPGKYGKKRKASATDTAAAPATAPLVEQPAARSARTAGKGGAASGGGGKRQAADTAPQEEGSEGADEGHLRDIVAEVAAHSKELVGAMQTPGTAAHQTGW